MGIKIKVGYIFPECSSHVYRDDLHVILLGFPCEYLSGDIQKKDITDWKFIYPRNMDALNISEPDLIFVEKLKNI